MYFCRFCDNNLTLFLEYYYMIIIYCYPNYLSLLNSTIFTLKRVVGIQHNAKQYRNTINIKIQ